MIFVVSYPSFITSRIPKMTPKIKEALSLQSTTSLKTRLDNKTYEDILPYLNQKGTFEDLQDNTKARKQVARSLAIFSAFAEGVALYSSFAVLYSFQMRDKLKGIGQQMKWSVRDESLHSKMGCQLFNHMCSEYPELKDQVREEVQEAARIMVEMEHSYIDKIFEQGDLENLEKDDLKEFIKKRANEKLVELGYEGVLEYNTESAEKLDWFYHLTGGHTHTDFFAIRSTDYAKAGEGDDKAESESLTQKNLRFALDRKGVTSVIVGTINPKHLKENVEAVEQT